MRVLMKNIIYSINHYQRLNIQRTATKQDIKSSFYKLAKQNHPDINNSDRETFQKIKQAYDILSNPVTRKKYDQQMFPQESKKQQQKKKNFYYYGQKQQQFTSSHRRPHIFQMIPSVFVFIILYYVLIREETVEDKIRRQKLISGNQQIDYNPDAQQRLKKKYAQQVKEKKIRASIVTLKVSDGSKQSNQAKDKRLNSISSIQGVRKQFINCPDVKQTQTYI